MQGYDSTFWYRRYGSCPMAANGRKVTLSLSLCTPVLSVITYGELLYGAERSQQRSRALESLTRLVSLLPVLPLPEEAVSAYGEIRATLEKRGEMIGGNDLWIAAHAKSAGLTLVTNNDREFKSVPGLKLQNWASRHS